MARPSVSSTGRMEVEASSLTLLVRIRGNRPLDEMSSVNYRLQKGRSWEGPKDIYDKRKATSA